MCTKGKICEVRTTWDETVEGRSLTNYNDNSEFPILVLQLPTDPYSFRMFSRSAILEIKELVDLPAKQVVLPPFVADEANKREKEARYKAVLASKKIGRGVTKEGQLVFNALEHIYPTTMWSGTDIIVMNDIVVHAPYKTTNVFELRSNEGSTSTTTANLLKRVKQIIEKCPQKT